MRRAGGQVARDHDSGTPPKPRHAGSVHKYTKKSNYIDISERSIDDELPYPDISRKAKQKRSRSRHGPNYESYNSDDNQRVRKRKKNHRQNKQSSDSDDVVQGSSRYPEGRYPNTHYPEFGRIKKGKSKSRHTEQAEETFEDKRRKGKRRAATPTTNCDSTSTSDDGSDED
jgi:hypothetical protein